MSIREGGANTLIREPGDLPRAITSTGGVSGSYYGLLRHGAARVLFPNVLHELLRGEVHVQCVFLVQCLFAKVFNPRVTVCGWRKPFPIVCVCRMTSHLL